MLFRERELTLSQKANWPSERKSGRCIPELSSEGLRGDLGNKRTLSFILPEQGNFLVYFKNYCLIIISENFSYNLARTIEIISGRQGKNSKF